MSKAEKWVIDRFEGGTAVLENMRTLENISRPLNKLPEGVKEGDVLSRENGIFRIERGETEQRAADIRSLFDKLKKKN